MDIDEFRAAVAADKAARDAAPPPEACPVPDTATSEEMVACGCRDCIDRALGREIELNPIGTRRRRRFA